MFLGKEEDKADMLRSILAQFEYSSKVKQYCADGVSFDKHLHIPEEHKLAGNVMCQREDEGHLFKVQFFLVIIFSSIVLVDL